MAVVGVVRMMGESSVDERGDLGNVQNTYKQQMKAWDGWML